MDHPRRRRDLVVAPITATSARRTTARSRHVASVATTWTSSGCTAPTADTELPDRNAHADAQRRRGRARVGGPSAGRLDVFATMTSPRVCCKSPTPLAGAAGNRPHARRAPDRATDSRLMGASAVDVFAIDHAPGTCCNGPTRVAGGAGSTVDWTRRPPAVAPAAVSRGNGRIDVVASDEVTDELIHWWQTGTTWRGPERLAVDPAASTPHHGELGATATGHLRRELVVRVAGAILVRRHPVARLVPEGRGPGRRGARPAGRRGRVVLSTWTCSRSSREEGGRHWWYDDGAWHGCRTWAPVRTGSGWRD